MHLKAHTIILCNGEKKLLQVKHFQHSPQSRHFYQVCQSMLKIKQRNPQTSKQTNRVQDIIIAHVPQITDPPGTKLQSPAAVHYHPLYPHA